MNDTIAAISTALGVGGISIIRLSGSNAIPIASKCFTGKDLSTVPTHTIHYGYIKDNDEIIDEVLVTVMKAPKTYTTEDIVEINCHGGLVPTRRILETVLNNGARLAEPGEFTKRAFLNGRIDLVKSEAIMDIIQSKSDEARKLAISQIKGSTSELIENFRTRLMNLLSSIEVNIDYPEYYDIEVVTKEKIKSNLDEMQQELEKLIKESNDSKIIKNGIKTVIIGKPNVGKSSILNKLLEQDKAIVTDIAGTTRDIVEGEIYLNGILLNIIDTAGIRETADKVEKIGVTKSLDAMKNADLVIVVLNKNDLPKQIDLPANIENVIETNTNSSAGIATLKDKIKEMFNLGEISNKDYTYLSNARQISLAKKAYKNMEDASNALKEDMPVDLIAIDLKECFDTLGEIIGVTYSDEIIDNLFENFCVGK